LQAMDSESKNSFIGSFLQPPDKMRPAAFAYIESKKLAAVGGDRPPILSNQAVVAALKTLQEKIRHLELEKSQAEDNLCSLSIAAAQYKKALEHESYKKETVHQELMQQRKDISVQLNAAQSRCSLLEKQLDYMRKMVFSAELEKKRVLEQQAQLQKEEDQNRLELHAKLEKLDMLEKECLKLTATQRIAEDKIKRLEEKLCKEEHQRKLIQEKTAQYAILVFNSEHQELLKKIQETQDSKVREDLEQELDCLVKQMEIKGEQISKLKKHQAAVQKLKRKIQKLKQGAAHVELKCDDQKKAKEIPVTVRKSLSKSCPGQKSRSSLQLLKNVQKLQSTLKKDDIMWE
uniref:Centrosomal protein 57kDa-like protein 1 n=1 Tax=Calidris pygmaea TaxID=425635 RepID=A0A8C3PQZ9_9CHAR